MDLARLTMQNKHDLTGRQARQVGSSNKTTGGTPYCQTIGSGINPIRKHRGFIDARNLMPVGAFSFFQLLRG